MSSPLPYPVQHAREIARRLDLLATYLDRAAPHEAAQIMDAVLDQDGIMQRLAEVLAHSARYAQERTPATNPHPDLRHNLAHGAGTLSDLALDLQDEPGKFTSLTEPAARTRAPLPTRRTNPGPGPGTGRNR